MAGNPVHAIVPDCTGPQTFTEARRIVAALIQVPAKFIEYVDANVAANLPPGSVIKGIVPHGTAYWTRTAAIQTEQTDGTLLDYFLKVSHTGVGESSLKGEFVSMTAIHRTASDFCPMPIAAGSYASDPDVHFYICNFIDMTEEIAELDTLPAKLADLHAHGVSPNGKCGFPVPTSQGALIMPNTWTSSWEKFFSDMMQRLFAWEKDMHGEDKEMNALTEAIIDKVIPRLLRPLETGGREIKPCLVHSDLWDGNTSIDAATDKPIIYDASSTYAHNEYELGAWNLPRHTIYTTYIKAYRKYFPKSAPEDDAEDRLIRYRLRFDITSSGAYLTNLRFRMLALKDMRYLVNKYPKGYEGSEARKAKE
ncbi:MAG: hypothetical protein Q9160_004767 [Pyrenula sp. 1 TL-2023]